MSDKVRSTTGPFAIVPLAVLGDTTINDRAFRVWCSIASFADYDTGETFAAQTSIADRMGVSVDTVQRAMKQLVGAGWLLVAPRLISGRKVGNIYTVVNGNRSSAAFGPRKPQNGATETADEHATETATGAVSCYQTNYQTTQDRAASPIPNKNCPRCHGTDWYWQGQVQMGCEHIVDEEPPAPLPWIAQGISREDWMKREATA